MTSSTTLASSSAAGAASSFNRPNALISSSSSSSSSSISVDVINVSKKSSLLALSISSSRGFGAKPITTRHFSRTTTRKTISCEVALRSDSTASSSSSSSVHNDLSSSSSSSSVTVGGDDDNNNEEQVKIGARVRVKVPLKVYHVPRVPEIDLTGKEGQLKQYVALWKGKRISANYPYKVEFLTEIEGRGSVKVFAHLKEDEFEYLPSN